MDKTVCIISHQHLCRNPRVLKECIALTKLSYSITILTNVYNASLLEEDYRLIAAHQINYIFYNNLINKNLTSFKNRFFNKVARYVNRIGVENKWALGYAPKKCLAMALAQNADLYICHQELPTYVGTQLIKKDKKVAFDFEDFYSEDLLTKDRKYRPQDILEQAERLAIEKGKLCYTTSTAMASELSKKYRSAQKLEVIYNSFNSFHNLYYQIEKNKKVIKLIWISQTIGPGRGLEKFLEAINNIEKFNLEINLRGNVSNDYKQTLTSLLINPNHKINFLPLLPSNEIQKDLIKYDIGLAMEPNYPPNKNLTISNKAFHYLSAGLPVIASSTLGQLSLKKDFEDGISFFKNKKELVEILSNLEKSELRRKSKQIKSIYAAKYDWSIIEKKLLNLVAKALNQND